MLGASGYTGADLVRLLARHPNVEIAALTANTHAGKAMAEVFPHFFMLDLPRLVEWEKVDWTAVDAVFCGLPHGTTQEITEAVLGRHPAIKFIDMSADFRLRDTAIYENWYGHEHRRRSCRSEAVYGLTEHYRDEDPRGAAGRLPGLLSDRGAARARCRSSRPTDRRQRHRHRRQVGRLRRRPRPEAEHPVHRSRRGAVALFGRQASPRAGDRAGDLEGRRPRRHSSTSRRISSR